MSTLKVNTIEEQTAANGVVIDTSTGTGVKIKDSVAYVGTITERVANEGVNIEGVRHENSSVGAGVDPTTLNTSDGDVVSEGGSIVLNEITVPTADAGYGKVYTKTDNSLYFQDGGGTERPVPAFGDKSTKVAAYTILTTDQNAIIELGPLNTADRTFTLPSVGATEDGMIFRCSNDSYYILTIAPADTDHVWNSGAGYGIELPDKGTMVTLRYNHGNTKWDIVAKAGGLVMIEGLKLMCPMEYFVGFNPKTTVNDLVPDLTGNHLGLTTGGIYVRDVPSNSELPPSSYAFAGTDGYIGFSDSTDWDIFGTITGHKTVSFWVYNDAVGAAEDVYVTHYEDDDNRWFVSIQADQTLRLHYEKATSEEINIDSGATTMAATTWYHVAFVVSGVNTGLYLNGAQVAWDATFSADTFSGSLEVGQMGDGADWFAGRMQDLMIAYNNPYGAVPNSTPDDSFTEPVRMEVVMT